MADKEKTNGKIVEETPFEVEPEQPELAKEPKPELPEPDEETGDEAEPKGHNIFQKFWHEYRSKKKIAIPATVILLLAVLFAIPLTRYRILGLVIKKDVILYTVDSKSKGIVFNSIVTIDGKAPGCGSSRPPYPNCFSKIPVGKHKIKVEAAFYDPVEKEVTVGLGKSKEKNVEIPMVANGSAIHIAVSDKITGKALANVHIKAGKSETLTTQYGGSIFVDFSADTVDLELSRDGYNTTKTSVKIVPGQVSQENTQLALTPSGKLYFLSKKTGKIDVVKTDLDGSNRQVVLAGTGNEEDTNTVLLAARDWKYLALQSRRDNGKAKLYLIDTSSDKLTEIDSGNATFTPVGWQDHYFAYTVYRDSVPVWQGKRAALKTYNAENQKLATIDETIAEGSGDYDYAGDAIESVYIQKDSLIYVKRWSASYYSVYRLAGKRMGIYSAKLNGTAKQALKDFEVADNGFINAAASKPNEIYYSVNNATTSYYEYAAGKLSEAKDINAESFRKYYPTYLLSPSGQATFWYEPRDGKNTLFTGTPDGSSPKEIASLSEYIPYGWYSDDYLLVSKNSSELYILPTGGPGDKGQVLKISDYHKPAINFLGYGGGYGGQ
jgi:hypothetical protein